MTSKAEQLAEEYVDKIASGQGCSNCNNCIELAQGYSIFFAGFRAAVDQAKIYNKAMENEFNKFVLVVELSDLESLLEERQNDNS